MDRDVMKRRISPTEYQNIVNDLRAQEAKKNTPYTVYLRRIENYDFENHAIGCAHFLIDNFTEAKDAGAPDQALFITAKRLRLKQPHALFHNVVNHMEERSSGKIKGELAEKIGEILLEPTLSSKNVTFVNKVFLEATKNDLYEGQEEIKKSDVIKSAAAGALLSIMGAFNGSKEEVLGFDPDDYAP